MFPSREGTFLRLAGLASANTPLDGYFLLPAGHANYSALYSLALVAAVNRYDLTIRTAADISNQDHAEIVYLVVDWT
jgi:hypothetical protein